jgi:hypothetical protein
VLALLVDACTVRGSSGATSAQPADLYAATPSQSEVRALLGDDSWWAGPPSFGVRPLNVASMPATQRFSVTQPFVHVGSAETLEITYQLWNSTSAATSHMTSLQNALGTSASGPKVGDQALYYGSMASSAAAPYQTATIVRVGQVVAFTTLALKDAFPTLTKLGKIAAKVTVRLKDVISGKAHGSPLPASDATFLPPAGLDITQLGAARISVEASLLMVDASPIDSIAQTLRGAGVNDVVFGDYALDADTHMEVRAALFTFRAAKDATDWLNVLRGTYPLDQEGIASFYDAAHGDYMFIFASATRTGVIICSSTASTEAASRACESPLSHVISAWKLSS